MSKSKTKSNSAFEEQGLEQLPEQDQSRLDTAFDILKNERRRRILRYLMDTPSTTHGELAEQLAAEENDTTPAELSSEQRKRVYVALYQSHLPKLDDAGVVSFDENRGTVDRGPRAAELTEYLDRLERPAGDGKQASQTLVAAGGVLTGLVAGVGLTLGFGLDPLAVGTVVLAGAVCLVAGLLVDTPLFDRFLS